VHARWNRFDFEVFRKKLDMRFVWPCLNLSKEAFQRRKGDVTCERSASARQTRCQLSVKTLCSYDRGWIIPSEAHRSQFEALVNNLPAGRRLTLHFPAQDSQKIGFHAKDTCLSFGGYAANFQHQDIEVCCTSVFMTLWHTLTSIHDITTKYPKPAELTIWLVIQKV
jgi:hypothetical protein